jgi:HlyD family secretion protein
MSNLKSRKLWIGVALLIFAGAAAALLLPSGDTVDTVGVESREVVELYVATGELRARQTSDIAPEIGGVVDTLHVDAGDRVERGDVLAELRPRDAKLAIDKAEAQVRTLEDELRQAQTGPTPAEVEAAQATVSREASSLAQAERELARAENLHDKGLVTTAQLDEARTAVEQAKAQLASARAELDRLRELPRKESVQVARSRLEQARLELQEATTNLNKTTLLAPYDALVLQAHADPGERVGPGEAVVQVANMSSLEIYAEIDEDYFGRIAKGQDATLIFPSMPERTFEATVRQLGPEIDTNRGTVGIHLDPAGLPETVFPGLTVDVNIEVTRLPQATAVPDEAVVQDKDGSYVLAVQGGKATRIPVEVLARGEEWTAIEGREADSISAGTTLVRQAAKIEPGDDVQPAGD